MTPFFSTIYQFLACAYLVLDSLITSVKSGSWCRVDCVDAVFACKYEQSHGLSIIKAQWGKKRNNKPRHAWWSSSMLHNVNSSLTNPAMPSHSVAKWENLSCHVGIYSYTFKSVKTKSVEIKIFSKRLRMISKVIFENIWKWHFGKCYSWKCQNQKC